jgi:hypothetical protein
MRTVEQDGTDFFRDGGTTRLPEQYNFPVLLPEPFHQKFRLCGFAGSINAFKRNEHRF